MLQGVFREPGGTYSLIVERFNPRHERIDYTLAAPIVLAIEGSAADYGKEWAVRPNIDYQPLKCFRPVGREALVDGLQRSDSALEKVDVAVSAYASVPAAKL
jgi:hypothetical protein